jgi:hypothetical protein
MMYYYIYLIYQIDFFFVSSYSLLSALSLTKKVVWNYLYEVFNYIV